MNWFLIWLIMFWYSMCMCVVLSNMVTMYRYCIPWVYCTCTCSTTHHKNNLCLNIKSYISHSWCMSMIYLLCTMKWYMKLNGVYRNSSCAGIPFVSCRQFLFFIIFWGGFHKFTMSLCQFFGGLRLFSMDFFRF